MESSKNVIAENLKNLFGQGGKAFKAKWPYIVIGMFAGLVLSVPDLLLNPRENPTLTVLERILVTLSGHLGIGFFVSSIAVFLYEWGSHEKELLNQWQELANLQCGLARDRDEWTLTETRKGKDAIEKGLKGLIPNKAGTTSKDIRKEICEIAINIHDLGKQDIWARDSYLNSLRDLLETVKRNSESLKDLRPEDPQHYVGVIRAADNLLTQLLESLNKGDKYYAITHLHTWTEERLPLLWEQTEPAVGRGVIVQRIFNLFRDCSNLNRAEVANCLTEHAELALKPTGYEAKIVQKGAAFRQLKREDLEHDHFVLIEKGESVITIEFSSTDLSELTLSTNKDRFNKEKAHFNVLWNNAAPINKALVEDIIRKFDDS